MAIKKIKINNVEHELETTIANVEDLQDELDSINNTYTSMTINGLDRSGSSATIYAPATAGTSGYFLKSNGVNKAPSWVSAPTADTSGLEQDISTLQTDVADIQSSIDGLNDEDSNLSTRISNLATRVGTTEDDIGALQTDNSDIWSDISSLWSDVQDHERRINLLEGNVCLKYDTQILMADGSTKNICDIQYGDMVKSWDLETNDYIDVKAYGAIRTGLAISWTSHIFDNGSRLEIFKNHHIYNVTHNNIVGSQIWKLEDKALGADGKETALAWTQQRIDIEFTGRYVITTENSLYFANGILCGHPPKDKLKYYSLGVMDKRVTEEEVAEFREVATLYDNAYNSRANNTEYIVEVAPILRQMSHQSQIIEKNKKQLADSDYKNNKRAQGFIDDIEWAEFTVAVENCRAAINEAEGMRKFYKQQMDEIKKRHGLAKRKTPKQAFAETYAIEMQRIKKKKERKNN